MVSGVWSIDCDNGPVVYMQDVHAHVTKKSIRRRRYTYIQKTMVYLFRSAHRLDHKGLIKERFIWARFMFPANASLNILPCKSEPIVLQRTS